MIQLTLLPVSSPEATRLKKWLLADEGVLLLQLANAEITRLECEVANNISLATEYPKHEDYAIQHWKEIQEMRHFLKVLDRFTKMEGFNHIKMEVKHEH